MRRSVWFLSTFVVLILMIFYVKQNYLPTSEYGYLNLVFLYNLRRATHIEITDQLILYIGVFAIYSLGVMYVLNTARALQRDFVSLVVSRLKSRGAYIFWNLKSILLSSIQFALILFLSILISLMFVFHGVNEIYFKEFWLLILNAWLMIAWIGNIEIFIHLKFDKFYSTVACFVIVAIVFSVVVAGDFVAMGDLSNISKMAWGSCWNLILYITTVLFIIISFRRMDI